jgi:adenosylcobinamide-GDP ribazoletransferase
VTSAAGGGFAAWPLVGALVGAAGGLAYWLALRLGCVAWVAAAWALAAQMLLTGALHEDGLADTADGFGGGATVARKLEIMRDSRIGTYGVLALAVCVMLRAAAMASLARPGRVAAALVVAGALGRAAMLVPLLVCPPARPDGMSARLPPLRPGVAAAGFGAAALCAALLAAPVAAVLAVAATAAIGWGMSVLAVRQIGGHSGDVLGAVAMVTECVLLSVLSAQAMG